ncbi:MAG: small GTP-binding protein [Alphaproteobacteria bacterium]|jgi:small GTP-binding protein
MTIRKILLLGEMEVGKTSIANRLCFDTFDASYKSTIGMDIHRYDVEPGPNGERFQFLVCDTDGNFEDVLFRDQHVRGAQAAIVVGDLTRRETLVAQLRLATKFSDAKPGRYLAGVLNKNDLTDDIPDEEDYLPDGLKKPFFPLIRTSAKTGENVERTFHDAAETIVRRRM